MGLTSSWNQASCTRWGAHSAAVSSLPLAKNAVHSPSSNCVCYKFWATMHKEMPKIDIYDILRRAVKVLYSA